MTSVLHRKFPVALAGLIGLAVVLNATCVKSEDSSEQQAGDKKIIVPESSKTKPGDRGKNAHTNYLIGNGGKPVTPPKPVGPDRNGG